MSADNTILIGSFPYESFPHEYGNRRRYGVAHVQSMEDCVDSDEFPQELTDASRVLFFGHGPFFDSEEEAMKKATLLHQKIGFVEYGICSLDFDRPLPSMTPYEAEVSDIYFDHKKIAKRIYTCFEVNSTIYDLAYRIEKDLRTSYEDEVVLVGILKGAMPFMTKLMSSFTGISYQYGFIDIRSWGEETSVERVIDPYIFYENIPGIQDKTVILVDDIIDTGRTIELAKKRMIELGAAKVIITSLLSKPRGSASVKDVKFYCGHEVENDHFIIGSGMGLGEKYRNLRGIWILEDAKVPAIL